MVSEDTGHGANTIIGAKMWGNKLCIPNQIRLNTRPDQRTVIGRIKDGVRAFLGQPCAYYPPPVLQTTIRTYVEEKGAKVVAIVRNPNHVVESIVRRGNQSVRVAKNRWAEAIREIALTRQEYNDQKVFIVRFKNLVSDPEATAVRLSEFLGVQFDQSMLEGHKHTPQYDNESINESRSRKKTKEHNLQEYDSDAFEMYRVMCREADKSLN
jgi:hypothetical protein